jgi:ParB family chromosome partitioning protein
MENKKKNNVLGRGLSALLTEDKSDSKSVGASSIANQAGVVIYIPLTQIEVNPFQPRTTFEVGEFARFVGFDSHSRSNSTDYRS